MKDIGSRRVVLLELDGEELRTLIRDAVRAELESSRGSSSPDAEEPELEPLLTASQLAELLNCGVRTLKRWLQEGVAPPPLRTPGSTLRWYRPAVRSWVEERCGTSNSVPRSDPGTAPAPRAAWRKVED